MSMALNNQMPDCCEASNCNVTLEELRSREPRQTLFLYKAIWFCPTCLQIEKDLTEKSEREAESRVKASRALSNSLVEQARLIDASLVVQEDIHNAYTVSLIEIEKAIQGDETITDKALAICEEYNRRYAAICKVAFDARQILTETNSQQRAIQTRMNTMLNQLRTEDRERLRLQDISYIPDSAIKGKVKVTKTAKQPKKLPSLAETKVAAAKFGVNVDMVRGRLTAHNDETAEEAAQQVFNKMKALGLL